MYCIRVTQVYFSLEKRASPWGSPEVSTPIKYTTAQTLRKLLRRTFVKKSGSVPGPERESGGQYTDSQYTTGQDMFGCRHGRFSTQPHKPCEIYPGSGGQYTDKQLKTAPIQNPIQYTSWKASYDKNAVYYVSEAPALAVIKR